MSISLLKLSIKGMLLAVLNFVYVDFEMLTWDFILHYTAYWLSMNMDGKPVVFNSSTSLACDFQQSRIGGLWLYAQYTDFWQEPKATQLFLPISNMFFSLFC